MNSYSSAEHFGYIIGLVMGIGFLLAVVAFSIFAIIKAFTRKTTGWIIAGSFGGAAHPA